MAESCCSGLLEKIISIISAVMTALYNSGGGENESNKEKKKNWGLVEERLQYLLKW